MTTNLTALLERVREAEGGGRELDHALAYHVAGIGTDLERAFYAEKGDAAFIPDQHGLTPMDYKNGDFVRQEWVKGTRRNPGGYKPRIWLNCNGPRPLRSCEPYTSSLDAAVALVERVRPGQAALLLQDALLAEHGDSLARFWKNGVLEWLPLALLAALLASLVEGE